MSAEGMGDKEIHIRFSVNWLGISMIVLLSIAVWQLTSQSLAQGGGLTADLYRSRDALLTQKSQLETASDRIGQQMQELGRQQDRIQNYLRDTDRALKDIDIAIHETR